MVVFTGAAAGAGVLFYRFLVLFFYVCWPYSAKPARQWSNWLPEADPDARLIRLSTDAGPDATEPFQIGKMIYLVDPTGADDGSQRVLGQFKLTQVTSDQLVVRPDSPISADQWGDLSFQVGPWTIHESAPTWPSHYAQELSSKERIDAEIFLIIDPLVSLSTALAAKAWVGRWYGRRSYWSSASLFRAGSAGTSVPWEH